MHFWHCLFIYIFNICFQLELLLTYCIMFNARNACIMLWMRLHEYSTNYYTWLIIVINDIACMINLYFWFTLLRVRFSNSIMILFELFELILLCYKANKIWLSLNLLFIVVITIYIYIISHRLKIKERNCKLYDKVHGVYIYSKYSILNSIWSLNST